MAGATSRSGIDFTWDPNPKLMAAQFDVLGVNIKSFKIPLDRSVRRQMVPSIKQNFAVGGRPAWQPLTNTTETIKAQRGHGPGILHATGRLSRRATAIARWKIDGPSGTAQYSLSSEIFYGIFHQLGWQPSAEDAFGDVYVEPRPFALIQDEDANEIEEIFFEWIEERIERDISLGKRAGF